MFLLSQLDIEKVVVGLNKLTFTHLVLEVASKALVAFVILMVGFWISQRIHKLVVRILKKSNLEPTFISFVSNLSYYTLLLIAFVVALSQLGIETSSLVTVLGTVSLAVGLALQGSLGNLAAGILLVILRYFKVGDEVEIGGEYGIVKEIDILCTQIYTFDKRLITVPNKKILEEKIINYVANPIRRLDLVIGIAYDESIDKVRRVLERVLANNSDILSDPKPVIVLGELGDSSVNLYVRPWVNKEKYWPVRWQILEDIKKAFDLEDISIPFPQRDIHVISGPKTEA